MIYIKKFYYGNLKHGERKKSETENGRKLLNIAVIQEFGINTDTLTIEKGEYGKPYFSDAENIFFNISHSGDYVAVGVAEHPIGVDIQTIRNVKDGLINKLCNFNEKEFIENSSDRNRAFITLWALKESYIKAIGKGMNFPMNNINFRLDNFRGEAEGEISNQSGYYYVKDCENFILAVCGLGKINFSVINK